MFLTGDVTMEKQKRYSKTIKDLAEKIKAVREPKDDDRLTAYEEMLAFLNYEEEFQIYEIDGLLIKAVEEAFPGTPNKVYIALICLGLMQGYYYGDMPKIEDRRHHLLLYINYLGRKERTPYAKADENLKKDYRKRFRKNEEEKVFLQLADYLICQNIKTLIEDLGGYIDEEQSSVILPEPGYLGKGYLERPLQEGMPELPIKTSVNTGELNEPAIKPLVDELCEPGQGRLFEDVASDIWNELGLNGDFDLAKFEAFLIKIIVEPHEEGRKIALKRDAGLLTFGLLHKYYHTGKKTAKERYWDYPNYGDYLDIDESNQREFSRLSAERQEEIIDELKQAGDAYKKNVCDKLLELMQNESCNSFMDDAISSYTVKQSGDECRLESKLQDPHYTLEKFPNMKYIEAIKYAVGLVMSMASGILLIIYTSYFFNQRPSIQPQDDPPSACIVTHPPDTQDDIEIARGQAIEDPYE